MHGVREKLLGPLGDNCDLRLLIWQANELWLWPESGHLEMLKPENGKIVACCIYICSFCDDIVTTVFELFSGTCEPFKRA